MTIAYVLINCELGAEEEIVKVLKDIKGIKEINGTFGAYDILVKVELDNIEMVREIIIWKIRKLQKIRSTLTLIEIEGQS